MPSGLSAVVEAVLSLWYSGILAVPVGMVLVWFFGDMWYNIFRRMHFLITGLEMKYHAE